MAVAGYFAVMWLKAEAAMRKSLAAEAEFAKAAAEKERRLESAIQTLQAQVSRLAKWTAVADADDAAQQLLERAKRTLAQAESDAKILTANAEQQYQEVMAKSQAEAAAASSEARAEAKRQTEEARVALVTAMERAAQIIEEANLKAEDIAGKAYDAVRNAELYERTAKAMRNIIEGYGDEYLKPAASLLDALAEEFSHKDAGQQLKLVREQAKTLVKEQRAASCKYVESSRREGAEAFVLDAFNGKVDSILSRVRHDNFGKLEQELNDAFSVVNYGGKPFREARITDEYLQVRLAELKWATIVLELKRQEQEEQRAIREQIREEEKARREYEKAIREAARDEEVLRKAMAKAQAQIAAATEEQRARYEAQLADLNLKLQDVEERNRRALSMAQQTRRGHVYIISNVGSLGENVFKIGLTRRLEPMDRIWELGDASVPFDFDVHAMILSDDAPALETRLHKHFILNQINKVNHRKEFFRANLAEIRREIERLGIDAKWTMIAEAVEYRETLAIERAIETDPLARERWLNRQLTLDPIDHSELVEAQRE